ncbi:MAG: YdgA family protein [Gammaproteobacteria bacterium]|nr:YdgA family protein [Gammaproteobacteria bacterium]
MRKWLSSLGYILATLVAIFLLLPLILGLLAEKKCNQIIVAINTTTPFSAKIINYHRGWFSADATAQISLDKFGLSNQELQQLKIDANIIHGPVLIDWTRFHFVQAIINTKINTTETQNNWLKRSSDAEPITKAKIKFRLSGETVITLDSPPLTLKDQDNEINWRGLKIRTTISPLYNQIKSDIDFPGIDIKLKDFDFNIKDLKSTYRGNKTSSGSWIGDRNIQLSSFSTKNENNHVISFAGMNIHNAIFENQGNLVNINTTITIEDLNINDAAYNQNKLDFEINNLNQALLAKLQQQIISSKIASSPTSAALDVIISILNNGGEIKIKELNTNTPWGKLLSSINATCSNQPNNTGLLTTIANSTVNANIKVERALGLHLLEKFYKLVPSQTEASSPSTQAENLLNDWLQSGKILTSPDDHYLHITFDYKDNQPSINNKLLTLTITP